MCIVVNKYKDEYDIYIGRGSKWGNPFPMKNKSDEERERVIEEYRKHLWKQISSGEVTKEELVELKGKRLACFCKPLSCHGDVIKAATEWAEKELNKGKEQSKHSNSEITR